MNPQFLKNQYAGHGFEFIKIPGTIDASVLIPLVENEKGELCVLFEIRSGRIRQGGEICFPGGRVETGETPEATVVRECVEELCIEAGQLDLIAPMFTLIGVGGAFIYSYLGSISGYTGRYSKDEVASVFMLPVEELLSIEPEISKGFYQVELPEDFHYGLIPGGRAYQWRKPPKYLYFYETPYGVIWGMTAELLHAFLEDVRRRSGYQ